MLLIARAIGRQKVFAFKLIKMSTRQKARSGMVLRISNLVTCQLENDLNNEKLD